MKTPAVVLVVFAACLTYADSWMAPRRIEAVSGNNTFVFVSEPHQDHYKHPFECRGTLYESKDGKRVQVWTRFLVNKVAPLSAVVSDRGEVVTMDEWYAGGTHPVVIYDVQGHVVIAHTLQSLWLESQRHKMSQSVSSIWWRSNRSDNDPGEVWLSGNTLCVWMGWGGSLLVDLQTGAVLNAVWAGEDAGRRLRLEKGFAEIEQRLTPLAVEGLKSAQPGERSRAASRAGKLRLKDVVARLKELTADDAFSTGSRRVNDGPEIQMHFYFVRAAAVGALKELNEDPGEVELEKAVGKKETGPERE